jgi:ferric-dicitrate binding protein FerR (iron transport regulator)
MVPRRRDVELVNSSLRLFLAMQDSRTYRQYAEECRKLAQSMPEHSATLLDMAAVWANLAEKAEAKEKKEKK